MVKVRQVKSHIPCLFRNDSTERRQIINNNKTRHMTKEPTIDWSKDQTFEVKATPMYSPKIAAFLEQVKSGKMQKDLHRIYKYLANNNNGWGLVDIERFSGMKRSTAAGRLSDLTDMGLIYQVHGLYFITPEDSIEAYAKSRENQRYERWRKLGEEKGWFGQQRMCL